MICPSCECADGYTSRFAGLDVYKRQINTNTDTFLFSSIGQLAERLKLSDATVSRFARHCLLYTSWEAEWAESGTALAVGMVAAAAVAIIALLVIKKNAGKKAAVN